MKPIRLTMSAFGPYADENTIDFEKLEGRNIFLITGPTGAGKTTIFDGISYAVFAKASGNERDGENLRSDFALPETLTYVELTFELRGKKYYIKRIPKQKRKKVRGDGYTEQIAEAELKIEDGRIITGVDNVNKKIDDIMGITYEQFRQIVMIPQGEFRELLLSESKEREVIFRKIFGTYIYEGIQGNLDAKSSVLRKEMNNLIQQRTTHIRNIDAGDCETLKCLTTKQDLNIREIIDKVSETLNEDSKKENLLYDLKEKIKVDCDNIQKKIFEANENNKKLHEKYETEQRIILLTGQKEKYNVKNIKASMARKALCIKGAEDYCMNRKSNLNKKSKEKDAAYEYLKHTKNELIMAEKNLKAQKDNGENKKTLSEKVVCLKKDMAVVSEYEKESQNINEIKIKLKNKEIEKKENSQKIDTVKEEMKDLTFKLDKAKSASEEYAYMNKDLSDKKVMLNNFIKLQKQNAELKCTRMLWNAERKKFESTEILYKKQKCKYEDMNELFLKGQAGLLAQGLKKDEPCPVCGSMHHPHLAGMIHGMPEEKELKEEKEKLEKMQAQYNELIKKLTELETEGKAQKNAVDEIKLQVKEYYRGETDDLEGIINKFNIEIKGLNDNVNKLNEESKKIKPLSQKIESLNEMLEQSEYKVPSLEEEYTRLYGEAQSKKNILIKFREELPEGISSKKALEEEIDKCEKQYEFMEKAMKEADECCRKTELAYNTCLADEAMKKKNFEDAENEFSEAREKFEKAVSDSGFKNIQDYNLSKLSEEEICSIEKEIKKYNEGLKSLNDSYERISKDTYNLQKTDVKEIVRILESKKSELDKTDDDIKKVYARKEHNSGILEEIKKTDSKIKEMEKQYAVISDLSETAKGNNAEKISFERYVLAAYFDDIIDAANIRFEKMTEGRYELGRIKERIKGNSQQGLELEVFDNYTGKSRHVRTLSGGESFKASLSLALGLSDVVQSHAGGVSLETMFIDEGFGTLDPESLEDAIECLIDLQKSGRLVGIISHVPELKERIEAQIEVIPGVTGSKFRDIS